MAEKLYEVEQREWTHGEVIGEHQQFFFKRLLKLDPDILQEMAKEKVISKKEKRNIEGYDYNMDYFLAIIKKKNVAKFAKFLEVLGTTFNRNENHKTLVSTMAKHLRLISDAQLEDKEIIERVVRNASDTGTQTECERNVEGRPPKGFIEPPMVEIFSREMLVNDTWRFYSPEHGVTILIHKDTVPDYINTIAVKMYAYLYGPFKVPEEYEICSAILLIQMDPKFKFLKPVTLKIPHSVLFDDHDEPEDFVVLRATDPVITKPDTPTPKLPDTHSVLPPGMHSATQSDSSSLNPDTLNQSLNPIPPPSVHSDVHSDSFPTVQSNSDSSTCPDTQASATVAYEFCDIIHTADFSEDFYVKVDLDHFSAVVAAKKRRKPRRNKRQNSLTKQSRSRRNTMKKRIKKLQKGGSIGSSRQSSYEGSFDREEREKLKQQQSPLVRQCSSAESDGPLHKQLQRQVAITDDGPSASPQQQSFDLSSNEIRICCCNPVQCTTNWTTRFMVAPNIPTGLMVSSVHVLHHTLSNVEYGNYYYILHVLGSQ